MHIRFWSGVNCCRLFGIGISANCDYSLIDSAPNMVPRVLLLYVLLSSTGDNYY